MTPTAQQQIAESVRLRGYLDGYTETQLIARHMTKLIEEITEAWKHIHDNTEQFGEVDWFRDRIVDIGETARTVFDNPMNWGKITVSDFSALRRELADCAVVLLSLSQCLVRLTSEPFDVIQMACEKAAADVRRGVRGATM